MTEKEKQARDLYNKFLEVFANSSQTTNISIVEPGFHWSCLLKRTDRECFIYCYGKEEFGVSYRINDISNARGRTHLQDELISSAVYWLDGCSVTEMHDKYSFIDPGKRALEIFQDKAIEISPELNQIADIKIEPMYSESYCLWFISSKRSCKIFLTSESKIPICEFYWDNFLIFEFYLHNNYDAALVLRRWFCDNVVPSDLPQEFPWLDKDKLSKLSNFEKVIEEQFFQSWNNLVQNYIALEQFWRRYPSDSKPNHTPNILKFIDQIRQRGFDRTLRAGISAYAMVLSRSYHHGLKNNQPYLIFEFGEVCLKIYNSYDSLINRKEKLFSPKIEYSPQIDILLKELEKQEIN